MSISATGIQGENLLLRALCRSDLETLRSFVNDPEVMQFSNIYRPISDVQQETWFEQAVKAQHAVWFGIEERSGSTLIGTCCLVNIDWVSRRAELRIRIGNKQAWGQGFGTEATRMLLRYGFLDLNLSRIWLQVYKSNSRALQMYENVGFQVEGMLRQAIVIKGEAQDVVVMGLLKDEWAPNSDIKTSS